MINSACSINDEFIGETIKEEKKNIKDNNKREKFEKEEKVIKKNKFIDNFFMPQFDLELRLSILSLAC